MSQGNSPPSPRHQEPTEPTEYMRRRRRSNTFTNVLPVEPHGSSFSAGRVRRPTVPGSLQNQGPARHQSQVYYQITGDDELNVIDEDAPEDFHRQNGASNGRVKSPSSIETYDEPRPNLPVNLPLPHGQLASSVANHPYSSSLANHQHPYAAQSYSQRGLSRGEDDYSDEPLISSSQPDYSSITDGVNGREAFTVGADRHDGFEPFSQHAIEDEEEPKSEPSSRRSSDTSLHDVCFPIESPRETDSVGQGGKIWPDLNVLTEFVEQELRDAVDADQAIVDDVTGERTSSLTSIRPSAQIDERDVEGRLRPAHSIIPWIQRNKRQMPKYPPAHAIDEKSKQYRFAYFREDLDATVHSANIAGLLQPEQTFADLFPPRISAPRSGGTPNNLDEYHWDSRMPPRGQTPVDFGNNGGSSTNGTSSPTSQTKRPSLHKRTLTQQMQSQQQQQPPPPPSAIQEPSPFWLNVMNPTEEEMKVLSKAFGIHPLTAEDIMLGETREKVELFRNYYFVCFRSIDTNWEKEKSRERERKSKNSFNKRKGPAAQLIYRTGANGYQEVPSSDPLLQQSQQQGKRRHTGEKTDSAKHTKHSRAKRGDLKPLNMYIIVFHEGILTFHFAPTSHPINVRRRARLLKDYITVSSDWISYALIDDVTDAFAPMIEAIEDEVNSIEEAILKMHSGDSSSDSEDSESEDESNRSEKSSTSSSNSSLGTKRWKEKGDMLRRVGECRKRVMSLLRLLGSKADVIKGFAKRCNEQWEVAPRSEIGLYLGDIQDHIVTMVQSLNHYEKLLARSHSNYLAQINIDMTRVNNDMNDVLGRITVLGTIVLPMNIVTGLWGMNVLVPGQDTPNLYWFWAITSLLIVFAAICFVLARRIYKI